MCRPRRLSYDDWTLLDSHTRAGTPLHPNPQDKLVSPARQPKAPSFSYVVFFRACASTELPHLGLASSI